MNIIDAIKSGKRFRRKGDFREAREFQMYPEIDENNPENLVSLASYLKRESYGTRPILYGPYYTGNIKSYNQGSPVYSKGKNKYEISDYKTEYEYDKPDMTIFPRIYSNQANHIILKTG